MVLVKECAYHDKIYIEINAYSLVLSAESRN